MGLFSSEEKDNTKLTENERTEKSQLQCRVIIEMLGKPQKHMEDTFKQLVDAFSKEEDIFITKKTISRTKKQGELFSRYIEVEFWGKSLSTIIGLCFDYMPSSVEILQPEKIMFRLNELNGHLNELQAKLHNVDMIAKNSMTEKAIISKNFFKLLDNTILMAVSLGPKSRNDLSRITGVKEDLLELPLKNLIEEKKVAMQGEKYVLK